MSSNLKTFYRVTLEFKAPLHIGKGSQDDYMGSAAIVHNGSGDYIIPGTSIAGVFASTLENCLDSSELTDPEKTLWQQIIKEKTADGKHETKESQASRLVFRTVALSPEKLLVRDKVRINRKTKTAADKAKFAQWELDPGRVTFLIEIDNMSRAQELKPDEFAILERWVETVLYSWQQEGVFFGGHIGTGNGYASLVKTQYMQLDKNNFPVYLSSSYHDLLQNDALWQDITPTPVALGYTSLFLKRYKCTVKVDLQNPLLIKGGNSYISDSNPNSDAAFINRAGIPFIPGSSFRGSLSSIMDKYGKTEWRMLLGQPEPGESNPDQGGCVIFTDLNMDREASPNWKLEQIERHAEDQFSRAIFGTGKFNEERLFNAVFKGEILVLNCAAAKTIKVEQLFGFLTSVCTYSAVSLGSGACHPIIILEECK